VASGIPVHAQSEQVWPEIDTFVKLNDRMRFFFLATTVKETRVSTEGEFGPNFDFYLSPLSKQRMLNKIHPDESKNRRLMLRVGYRYIYPYTGNSSDENRIVLEATGRHLLWGGVLVSDRNRLDLRFRDAGFSWRYRNRVTAEKEFSIGCFKFNPYARGELYYDSRYDKVSRTELTAGSVFPITRRVELEGYFLHQNDTGGTSNRSVNGLGIVINLYF
jgi:hypothetical protein